jgi:hypothetical protein
MYHISISRAKLLYNIALRGVGHYTKEREQGQLGSRRYGRGCKVMNETKTCQNCKAQFTVDEDDLTFYEKVRVPPPTFCWLCRAQRRMAFRNERILYKRKSDFSGQDIFSMYAPASNEAPFGAKAMEGRTSGYMVYEKEVWLTDRWDPLEYGREYDFSRPFFEQFDELLHKVPLKNLNVVNGVRSDYSNNFTEPKNCYLCFNGNQSENCMYSHGITFCRDCADVSHCSKCEMCFDSFWITSGTKNIGCKTLESCFDMWFCKNCVGCSNCVGCAGLRKVQYHIFNRPYSKEEYQKKLSEMNLGSFAGYQKARTDAREFWLKFPNKYIEGLQNTNVSGNYIDHSKNVKNSFLVREGENLKFCQYLQELPGCKDCYDWSIWGDNGQMMYECHACGIGTHNIRFSLFVQEDSRDIEYSMICSGSSSLFGCVGLRKKQYCILNKQYGKEEYEALAAKIREQMNAMPYRDAKGRVYAYGEFFPAELSPVGYNESMAQEYFPMSREAAASQGYKWHESAERNYAATIVPADLPDDITGVTDSIMNEIIACSHKGTNCNELCVGAFKITPDELTFYRKLGVPIPRLCHNCRTFGRLKDRTGLKLYARSCSCAGANSQNGAYQNTRNHAHGASACPEKFEAAYKSESSEIIYCENCYLREVS